MIKNMPIEIQNSKLTAVDKEQLSLLFENAGRKLYDILNQRFGKTVADSYKIWISDTDPIPAKLQTKTVTLSVSANQNIVADTGYDGLEKVTVPKVTAAIDANIVAGNIKKDVVILGVTGTYAG